MVNQTVKILVPQCIVYKKVNILINKATSCSHTEQLWPSVGARNQTKCSLALRQWLLSRRGPIPHLPLHFLAFLNAQIN